VGSSAAPMIQSKFICLWAGVFIESKFMVSGAGDFGRSAEVFDPTAGAWRRWEDMLTFRGEVISSCLVASSCGELTINSCSRSVNEWLSRPKLYFEEEVQVTSKMKLKRNGRRGTRMENTNNHHIHA
jgi:hypothetical protein